MSSEKKEGFDIEINASELDSSDDELKTDLEPRHSELKPLVPYWASFKKTSKISWQAATSYTFCLQMVINTYLLSQLNDDNNHLAAVTLIATVINSAVLLGVSPLLAMGLSVSQEIGEIAKLEASAHIKKQRGKVLENQEIEALAKKRQIISGVLRNGLIIGTVTSATFIIPVMVFSEAILVQIFFQDPQVAKIAQNYIRPYALAVPGIMARVATDQVLYAFERTKPAMLIGLASFSFWMPLSAFLAFGPPKLGANGLLIGSIIDGYTTSLGYAAYLGLSPKFKKYNFLDFLQPWLPAHIEQMKNIRGLGRSILLSMTAETSMTVGINIFAGALGVEQQAAFSTIMQISLLTLLLQIAFGQTASQAIGQYIGADEFENSSRVAKTGVVAMTAFLAPVLIVLAACPEILLAIQKNQSHSFKHIIQTLAPIIFTGLLLDAIRFQLLQQSRSLGAAKQASLISCSFIIAGLLSSYLLGFQTKMGIYGVATGYTSAMGLACIGLSALWLNKVKPKTIAYTKKHPEQFRAINIFGIFKEAQPTKKQREIFIMQNPIHNTDINNFSNIQITT